MIGDALGRDLLRAHVRERAEQLARRRHRVARGFAAREPEVGELHAPARVDEDVRGLDVAVQDADLVRGVQRARDVDQDPQVAVEIGVLIAARSPHFDAAITTAGGARALAASDRSSGTV